MALCYSRAAWWGNHIPQGRALPCQTVREGPEFRCGRPVLQSPLRSWKFYDVIPEIDIWRAATLMLKHYGERALEDLSDPDVKEVGWVELIDCVEHLVDGWRYRPLRFIRLGTGWDHLAGSPQDGVAGGGVVTANG
jgi:hypothetical protein